MFIRWPPTWENIPSDVYTTKTQISLHIRAVWSVFVIRMKKHCIFDYPKWMHPVKFWSDSPNVQADLNLCCAHIGSMVSDIVAPDKKGYCVINNFLISPKNDLFCGVSNKYIDIYYPWGNIKYTVFTLNIRTAELFTKLALKFEQDFTTCTDVSQNCWMSDKQVDPHQILHSLTSDLGLHCLFRSIYSNT